MRKRNGFTIIEMLVTIAIISIISAVAVFSITTYINNTKYIKIYVSKIMFDHTI